MVLLKFKIVVSVRKLYVVVYVLNSDALIRKYRFQSDKYLFFRVIAKAINSRNCGMGRADRRFSRGRISASTNRGDENRSDYWRGSKNSSRTARETRLAPNNLCFAMCCSYGRPARPALRYTDKSPVDD